jgi:hypothetical protein
MNDFVDLEQRLSSYGATLADELATWPTFNPATLAASTPLQLLWRRRGRWLGAGHRPPFAGVAAIVAGVLLAVLAAIALLLVFRPGADDTRSVEVDAAAMPAADPSESAAPVPASGELEVGSEEADPPAIATGPEPEDAGSAAAVMTETDVPATEAPETEAGEIGPTGPEPVVTVPAEAVAPPSAVPSSEAPVLACRSGLLVNDQCRISSPAPAEQRNEACVAQGGVDDGEAGCFVLVDAAISCPSPGQVVGGECQVITAPTTSGQTCPQGGELDGDVCRSIAPPAQACADGVEVEGACRIERSPAEGGELVCPGGGRLDGNDCVSTIAGGCTSGAVVPGGCAVPGPVETRKTCPNGVAPGGNQCLPGEGCQPSTQSKEHTNCGKAPTIERICVPTGAISNGDDCFTVVPADCPAGSSTTGAGCEVRTAAAPTPFRCAAGQLLVGTSCFEEQALEPSCVEGVLASEGCIVTRPATAAEPTCPATASLRAGQCVAVVAGEQRCATGELVAGQCRVQIELDEALLCAGDAQFDRGSCVRFEEPVER